MRQFADYWGYELGNFLVPKIDNIGMFFLMLQKPLHYKDVDDGVQSFQVKLGKTRFLNGDFSTECLKVLVYYATEGGYFSIYDISLSEKKDGTKYFDAVSFLNQLKLEYKENDLQHYRYFKSRLRDIRQDIRINDSSTVSFIHRRINADDYEMSKTFSLRVSKNE